MHAFYTATLAEYVSVPESTLVGMLTSAYATTGNTDLKTDQVRAWVAYRLDLRNACIQILNDNPAAERWTIALEYEIPRKLKRIDAVLLTENTIFVLELKTKPDTSALNQAEDYALLLHYFHEPSFERHIYPLVVSQSTTPQRLEQQFLPIKESPAYWVHPVRSVRWDQLSKQLLVPNRDPRPFDHLAWLDGAYHPVPGIIEAARSLVSGLSVREIAHSKAARHDVEELTAFIDEIVQRAKQDNRHVVCFVTGVPGSGKTLVGLNLAFAHSESREPIHFMSGNGPLVSVLQTSIAKHHRQTRRVRQVDAERDARTLIENVHVFAKEYTERDTERPPSNHVVIFDEAQRAWNREHNWRKFRRDYSEPEMLMKIMSRHTDWAVVIALVGGGQEINSGEAGLASWGDLLDQPSMSHWTVFASPAALDGSSEVAFSRLFEATTPSTLHVEPRLHLDVSVRSLRAGDYSDWVNAVLEGRPDDAKQIATEMDFPVFIVRSLGEAKSLLRESALGESRSGFVASSKAARLRAEGLEPDSSFHRDYPWHHWYLAGKRDLRASTALEVFASEFEIQGLELDWVGVCWDGDLLWSSQESAWIPRRFNAATSKWSPIKSSDQKNYRRNAYRVLLTRARQGVVIYVPVGSSDDPTRQPAGFMETAEFLLSCGAIPPALRSAESNL